MSKDLESRVAFLEKLMRVDRMAEEKPKEEKKIAKRTSKVGE